MSKHHRAERRARRGPPGGAPGALIHDPHAGVEIDAYLFGPGSFRELRVGEVDELKALRGTAPVLWVDVHGSGNARMLDALARVFGLHPLAVEDSHRLDHRAKVEAYDDVLLVITRAIGAQREGFATEQLSLFVGRDFVVTIQDRRTGTLDGVRERLRRGGPIRGRGPDYLAYALLDAVVDHYFPVLESVGEELDRAEDEILSDHGAGEVERLHRLRRDLLQLRRALWPQREMLNALIRDSNALVGEETRVFLRDCYDHVVQLLDFVETGREMASDLIELRLSQSSHRMNEIMKVLTVIATIFIPLGFIAGLYGMNFDRAASPLNMPELGWYWGYPYALALMAAVAGGLLAFFWRKGWIGGPRRGR